MKFVKKKNISNSHTLQGFFIFHFFFQANILDFCNSKIHWHDLMNLCHLSQINGQCLRHSAKKLAKKGNISLILLTEFHVFSSLFNDWINQQINFPFHYEKSRMKKWKKTTIQTVSLNEYRKDRRSLRKCVNWQFAQTWWAHSHKRALTLGNNKRNTIIHSKCFKKNRTIFFRYILQYLKWFNNKIEEQHMVSYWEWKTIAPVKNGRDFFCCCFRNSKIC